MESRCLISVKNLKKHFPIRSPFTRRLLGWVHAVDDISFDMREGETYSLIGESGCGKSTTAKLLLLLEEPTSGSIYFKGKNILTADKSEIKEYRYLLQAMFQDPFSSLQPRMRTGTIVAEPLVQRGIYTREEIKERVEDVLGMVRLPNRSHNFPHEFSGGERQRIALARALAPNPKVIILDEPVSALDVSVRAQVMNHLKDAQEKNNLTFLLIAHDLSTVRYMTHTMGVMYLGKIVETGFGENLFQNPLHPYTQALLKASLPLDPDRKSKVVPLFGEVPSPLNVPTGCSFSKRCYKAEKNCSEETPKLREVASGHWVACLYV